MIVIGLSRLRNFPCGNFEWCAVLSPYIYIYIYTYILVLSKLTQIPFNGTNFINVINAAPIFSLTRGPTRSWRNGDAQICQLSNIADPFSDTFPLKKSAQTLFSLRESPVLTQECEVMLSQHAHTPLSLSPCLLSFCSARAHTSLSLSASAQFLFSVRQRRAELNSVKHRYYVACFSNFTCKYSQNTVCGH